MCQDGLDMRLKGLGRTPPGGWLYNDPELKRTITGDSYQDLVGQVVLERASAGIEPTTKLGQMIQDQICDRAGKEWCEGFGLGDAVAMVAQPIAAAIDMVAGTDIKGCGACAKRRANLNF